MCPSGDGPSRFDSCKGGHAAWNFCSPASNVDITIIGAGTATMGAGRFIERYNEQNDADPSIPPITYRILEADGGPDSSGTIRAPSLGRSIASYFLHGGEGNPIYELKWLQEQVRGLGLTNEATVKWGDVKPFRCTGGDYGSAALSCSPIANTIANAERNEFRDVRQCARDDDKVAPAYPTLEDALNKCYDEVRVLTPGTSNWLEDGDRSRIWKTWDYEYAEDPRSTADFTLDETYYCTGQKKDIYVPAGAKGIVEREYEFYGIDRCTCAGATVTDITFENPCTNGGGTHCIKVETATSGTFYTKEVILTPSVGVLARGAINIQDFGVSSAKHTAMMNVFFKPDTDVTHRASTGYEYNPLYYVVVFQFSDAKAKWNDNFALINVDFEDPGEPPYDKTATRRVMCRWWEVWNNQWGDWHDPDSNMIACVLTTEDVEFLEKLVAAAKGWPAGTPYSIPEYTTFPPYTRDPELDTAITNLFRNAIAKAYPDDISSVPEDCSRCGLSFQGCACNPAVPTCNATEAFDPDDAAPPLDDDECRYRVFPSKNNTLWYGAYENVNDWLAFDGTDYLDFTAPIDNPNADGSIHMAGAATCWNYWGFLHGSYYSGLRAANASIVNVAGTSGTFPCDEKLDISYCGPGDPPQSIGSPRSGCKWWE